MASPTNAYFLQDDYGASAGPSGGSPGTTSGDYIVGFTAVSAAAAVQVAYIISSALQRPLRLGNQFNPTLPLTLITGIGANTGLTSVPSGIAF
jgi:hypothetical protein